MKHILIVDDDATGRCVLRLRLQMRGYVCHEVEDGSAALETMQTNHFDLVITDHQMPVMTGLELLKHIKNIAAFNRPPVIFVTGHLSDDLRDEAERAGACAVLAKPYEDREIMIEVARLLAPQLRGTLTSLDRKLNQSRH